MVKQDRHIALSVDNCSAHPKDCGVELTNVAIYFFPPNVTSVIQPCDMGIIRNLKALYRKSMIQPCDKGIIHNLKALYRKSMISRIVSHLDSEASITVTCTRLSRQMNVLDAMHMLKVAWSD